MTGSTIALLAPALSVNAVLFAGGLGFAIAQSFGLLAPVGVSQLTTGHYAAAMQTTEFTQSLILTLHVAVTSTLLSAVAALVVSLSLHSLTPALPALRTLLQIPIAVPHVAMSIATIHLIAPSGLVARVLHSAGLVNNPSDFPALLQDRWGGAIILVYILKETPFLA
ncbi:MAG: hypothetical protein H7039_22465, partial [Bryobacteraceae bacterium]|nr:hypothetical protein [Bryobacteraceae bacterium]